MKPKAKRALKHLEKIRGIDEIKKAISIIDNNAELTYGYRIDVVAVLEWVLNGEDFDGMSP